VFGAPHNGTKLCMFSEGINRVITVQVVREKNVISCMDMAGEEVLCIPMRTSMSYEDLRSQLASALQAPESCLTVLGPEGQQLEGSDDCLPTIMLAAAT